MAWIVAGARKNVGSFALPSPIWPSAHAKTNGKTGNDTHEKKKTKGVGKWTAEQP
jgi:hypothetical protein